MGDLISRKALLEDFRHTITEQSDTMDWLNMIARQPSIFVEDEIINMIDNKVAGITNLQINKIYEILKSAANATNGKIGR